MRSLVATLTERLAPRQELRAADPSLPWGDSTPPTNGMLGSLSAGVNVTEGSAVGIAAVFTAVSILADAVSTLPLRQFRKVNGETQEMDPSPVIQQPFVELTLQEWLEQGVYSECLRGNAYFQIIDRDPRGFPLQVMPLHPDNVSVRRDANGALVYRTGGTVIDLDDIVHIRGLCAPRAVAGVNPIQALRNTFGLARAAELYQGSFYENSAQPGGILEVPGDADRTEARKIAALWNEQHQGIGQANSVAVLSGGVKFQAIAISPEDAQFIQSRQFSRQEIGSIFRIPPHMMGDVDRTTSWGTGIEQQELGFVRTTLLGKLKRREVALSNLLPLSQFVRFDLRERLRGDQLSRYQAYIIGRTGSWLTPEEIRQKEDMPPLGDEWADFMANPMSPLNSAQNGSLSLSVGGPNPMGNDPGSQKSPSS